MCAIDTVNGTLGMEWGVGNELTGSEFNFGYIKLALSLRVSTRDHAHTQNRGKEWVEPHLHSLPHWILGRLISCLIVQ